MGPSEQIDLSVAAAHESRAIDDGTQQLRRAGPFIGAIRGRGVR